VSYSTIAETPALAFLVGFFAVSVFLWLMGYLLFQRNDSEQDIDSLKLRLRAYAHMHDPQKSPILESKTSGSLILSPEEHKILLGTLKKIEAKNAVLLAATLPTVVITTTIILRLVITPNFFSMGALAGTLAYAIYLVFHRLDGSDHLGQKRFLKLQRDNYNSLSCTCRRMQYDLMLNLLDKERLFNNGRGGMLLVIVALIVSLFLQTLSQQP